MVFPLSGQSLTSRLCAKNRNAVADTFARTALSQPRQVSPAGCFGR